MSKQCYTRVSLGLSLLVVAGVLAFYHLFTIPNQPELLVIQRDQISESLHCYQDVQQHSLDQQGQLNLLVWNIYKQNRPDWSTELSALSVDRQLLLLQEANLSPAFEQWIRQHDWAGTQTRAFTVFGEAAGVINLAQVMPSLACAYTQQEPWLRLPKSAIYARYPLSNQQQLAVVNLHAVNFSYGTKEYQQQLGTLLKLLEAWSGPMIVAGDFNSWSEARMALLDAKLAALGLQAVAFTPDHRSQFINGLALDHIFYRGLVLENAQAPKSGASDHNPLLVSFRLVDPPSD
ncbi:endonuclease/exonuclease/phosphatase family protein [Vibrio sp. HDW18]|uniref:endonuclease/exonuclease/phosphatase family protein n=1 Tax=Vibrio sp. HDW18 TaxID=2714948 RepID=UPI001409E332|nr:endonuclease/exonuclease/phosphatase family protein [Vibrio sp. HDW18]QIL84920.1 endonuclease/exonuclease/phosphatase family protein [Vibrio sp. HDW18]